MMFRSLTGAFVSQMLSCILLSARSRFWFVPRKVQKFVHPTLICCVSRLHGVCSAIVQSVICLEYLSCCWKGLFNFLPRLLSGIWFGYMLCQTVVKYKKAHDACSSSLPKTMDSLQRRWYF